MTPALRERIERARDALAAHPDLIVTRDVGPPGAGDARWGAYGELLGVCDGARFGELVLWSAAELDGQQYRIAGAIAGEALCVGQLDVSPLALDGDGELWLVGDERYGEATRRLGRLDDVLLAALDQLDGAA